MKKKIIIILTIITLILTFLFAKIFCIYQFESVPTISTSLYLISIFSILEYLSISITYIIKKLLKKEKIQVKIIIELFLLFISLLLILTYLIILNIDYLNWYMNSAPFYLNVIVRSIEFLIPSIILIILSIKLIKNNKNRENKNE